MKLVSILCLGFLGGIAACDGAGTAPATLSAALDVAEGCRDAWQACLDGGGDAATCRDDFAQCVIDARPRDYGGDHSDRGVSACAIALSQCNRTTAASDGACHDAFFACVGRTPGDDGDDGGDDMDHVDGGGGDDMDHDDGGVGDDSGGGEAADVDDHANDHADGAGDEAAEPTAPPEAVSACLEAWQACSDGDMSDADCRSLYRDCITGAWAPPPAP